MAVCLSPRTAKSEIRVLFVDDDDTIRSTISSLLRTKRVITHHQVAGLVSVIRTFDPHVVLLDYSLGDGDAFTVLSQFDFTTKRNIPIIFTGMQLPEPVKTQLYMLGVMNIIMKPSTISTIESVIENYYEISLKYRS